MRILTEADAEAACLGGGVFACGGGGWLEHGLQNGRLATTLGRPQLASIDELPDAGVIVTISAIGAPAAPHWEMWPKDYLRAFDLLRREIDEPIVGLINAQNGYSSTVNPWLHSALTGVPVVDASGDVRAHPTIKLGAMGFAGDLGFSTVQTAAGGNRARGAYLEVVARGTLVKTSNLLRRASVESDGFIAAARLPLPVRVVRERAALGAVSVAIRLGVTMRAERGSRPRTVIEAITQSMGGEILGEGEVSEKELRTEGGFDHARIVVEASPHPLALYALNEFMAVDAAGRRAATYPDVITVLSTESGMPVPVSAIAPGTSLAVLRVDSKKLPRSAGAVDPAAYPELEELMGLELQRYALGEG